MKLEVKYPWHESDTRVVAKGLTARADAKAELIDALLEKVIGILIFGRVFFCVGIGLGCKNATS